MECFARAKVWHGMGLVDVFEAQHCLYVVPDPFTSHKAIFSVPQGLPLSDKVTRCMISYNTSS